MPTSIDFEKYRDRLEIQKPTEDVGKVTEVRGFLIKGIVPGASVGSLCKIQSLYGRKSYLAEVIGFASREVFLMPLEDFESIGHGSKIILHRIQPRVPVGDELIGRVVDGLGRSIDGKGSIFSGKDASLYNVGVNPLSRPPIREPMSLGVRAIDALNTLGKGQRVGIMAGSGVGKSVLLGMMAKNSTADVNVIALIGERGREVREFIENILGPEGLARSVIVVATSDQSPLMRTRAAFYAKTIAESFSAQGQDVLFMMDSATRFAMAQREIGLNLGEPPTMRGYTPSVFSLLPKLLERAGQFEQGGSITGLYTVLVEGDDMDDPIGDTIRSIVDGHIVLSRRLAHRGHFPAIDILQSASRVMLSVTEKEHQRSAVQIKNWLAHYEEAEDIINIGAYQEGANPVLDDAVRNRDAVISFLKQDIEEGSNYTESIHQLMRIAGS